MNDALELGMTGVDKVVDKHYDKIYDGVQRVNPLSSSRRRAKEDKDRANNNYDNRPVGDDVGSERSRRRKAKGDRVESPVPRRRRQEQHQRPRTDLPSPEVDRERGGDDYYSSDYYAAGDVNNNTTHYPPNNLASTHPPPPARSSHAPHSYHDYDDDRDFERQSEVSERVLRDYENEKDDPRRRPSASVVGSTALPNRSRPPRDSRYRNDDMSNGYGYDNRRPSSQQPPRSRHYDDGDSDYDERTGQVYRKTSRGYDDGYDREIVETERYRGPARDWGSQRSPSFHDNEYQVTNYNRSSGDVAAYDDKRRSRSRGRHDRDSFYGDERGSHHHHERSRSRGDSFRDKIDDTFDKSARGIGVGIAGAVIGSLAAKQFGDRRHSKRDMVIGAVIGGLGANAAEQKYRDWSDDRKEDRREDRREDRLTVPGYDSGYRSRSANR